MASAADHPPEGKSMYQIYQTEAGWYDALVSREDVDGNFANTLLAAAPWHDAVVVEAGIGTGRVTRIYAPHARRIFGFDRSQHMLERARANLAPWTDRLTLEPADNLSLPPGIAAVPEAAFAAPGIFVEGWSFGHVAVDHAGDVADVTRRLVDGALATLRELGDRPAGPGAPVPGSVPAKTLVFVETLGTGVDLPQAPAPALSEFYQLLEQEHGFTRRVVQTDYEFASIDEATASMGFFFGKEMAAGVAARGLLRVPEFTGIWTL